jgi:hypothetical protein
VHVRIALLAFAAALIFVGTCVAQDVYLKSLTPAVTQTAISKRLPGLRVGVKDFQAWWGGERIYLKLGRAPAGSTAWQISIAPFVSVFYSGYHSIGPSGPYARVFVAPGANDWTVTLTHELFEMAADPYLVRTVQSDRLYLIEVADPVEAFDYTRLGVRIADFVGPDWYVGGRYFDFMHLVEYPHQLLEGGYVSYWNGYDWAQLYA